MDKQVLHELTMLYLKQLNLSSLTPEQLCDEYYKTYATIKEHYDSNNESFVQLS